MKPTHGMDGYAYHDAHCDRESMYMMQSMVVASATEITDALVVAMMIIYAGASGYTPAISLRSSSSAVYLSMSLTFLTPMSVFSNFLDKFDTTYILACNWFVQQAPDVRASCQLRPSW